MIQIFSLTLAANEAREVAVTGEYFELRNALYPIALVELLDRSGGVISRLENPEQSDFVKPGRYETIRITNGPTAQTIRHFYGSGDAGSRRTSGMVKVEGIVTVGGDVSVIDGEKSRVLAGGMYSMAGGSAPVAGQYSGFQLFNPAGSGKNLIVKGFDIFLTVSGTAIVFLSNVEMAFDNTALRIGNKKSGGIGGVALAKYGSSAVLEVTYIKQIAVQANVTYPCAINGAIVLTPGYGLGIRNIAVNVNVGGNIEWFEESL